MACAGFLAVSSKALLSAGPARGREAFTLAFRSSGFLAERGQSLENSRLARYVLPDNYNPDEIDMSKFKTELDDPDFVGQADMNWADPDEVEGEAPAQFRDVKVEDVRDINELLRLPNPLKPTPEMQLVQVTLDDGSIINRPKKQDLEKLRPSKFRPVTFKWKDRSEIQTGAPKQYDEFIQKLLTATPSDMEDLVRANWQKFDSAFFFRIMELREDTSDPRLKEKLIQLEKFTVKILEAAQKQQRHNLPETAKDAREILHSMLEEDGDTLLWPPPPAAYQRLAEAISLRATRAKYEDGWFENIIEAIERFALKMENRDEKMYLDLAKICLQRMVTEWLRNDELWEETDEGQFIFRLMAIAREQWTDQLFLETAALDTYKIKEELKIISETKIIKLPMASKLQIYSSKYITEMLAFIESKDELLQKKEEVVAS
eukprot:TRINITY_DN102718_c0_g1_i1.p1 TRINITY_DN102718_c0_g1~~TRINITY_DN102718_c0_g1_i1.p1  ORF type:complete len:498 (+),score=141.11 TRINITY_DN102718_c0_g1_i1:201-1496(+)